MNIIESEIKKREDLIAAREEKLAEAEALEIKVQELRQECELIKVEELQKDIDELKTYLPQPDEPDQPDEQAVDGTGQPVY